MTPAQSHALVSVEDYLQAEEHSTVRHEYLGGVLHAMSGGRNVHNLVASNLLAALWSRLGDGPCLAYNSNTKVRIRAAHHTRFYYPDVSVVCKPNPPDHLYQDHPVLVAEVLSDSSRRVDSGEKLEAYCTIPSLETYLMVEPETPLIVVFRRTENGFERSVLEGAGLCLSLPHLEIEVPGSEIYRGVSFTSGDV